MSEAENPSLLPAPFVTCIPEALTLPQRENELYPRFAVAPAVDITPKRIPGYLKICNLMEAKCYYKPTITQHQTPATLTDSKKGY